jgi:hypothetical protein
MTIDLKTLDNTALWQHVDKCASSVSYYNAAEGDYSRETNERNAAKAKFREAREELASRGVEWINTKGYLT